MVKRDTIAVFLVGAFIVMPAILSLCAYFVTRNPNLRPLAITIERLAEAGLISDSGKVVAVVSIGQGTELSTSRDGYKEALETAFERFQTEVRVKFRTVPSASQTTITYLVGNSRIGPYPISRAAEGIRAATEAERMIVAQQKALEKERLRLEESGQASRLYRIFEY